MPALSRNLYAVPVGGRRKKECCIAKPRCKRCPIRMLSDGKLSPEDAKEIFAKNRNCKALKKAKLTKAA